MTQQYFDANGNPVTPQGVVPQQQAVPQQQVPVQAPTGFAVTQEVEQEAIAEAEAIQTGGDFVKPNYVKWLGPNGETRWQSTVRAGYEATVPVFICSPWAPGKPVSVKSMSHFYYPPDRPQGTSLTCPGDTCPVCAAVQAGMNHPDSDVQARAKRYRVRKQWFYNVFLLENPQAHVMQDGVFRPFVLGAGTRLHQDIQKFAKNRGMDNIANFTMGRPLLLTKKKTGPEERNVEYSVMDRDPIALPQEFWAGAQNLWDLEKLIFPPNFEKLNAAVGIMGLPGGAQPQAAAYNPNPTPPAPNPYQQQAQPQAPQAPTPPMPQAPAPVPVQSAPAPQGNYGMGQAPQQPAPQAQPQQPAPQAQPVPQGGGTVAPPFSGAAPQQGAADSAELQALQAQLAGM